MICFWRKKSVAYSHVFFRKKIEHIFVTGYVFSHSKIFITGYVFLILKTQIYHFFQKIQIPYL